MRCVNGVVVLCYFIEIFDWNGCYCLVGEGNEDVEESVVKVVEL